MTKFLWLIFLHAAWNLSDLYSTERCFLSLCLSPEVTGTEMTWTGGGLT